jgi:hypothetical protein
MKCYYHPYNNAVSICIECREYICEVCQYGSNRHPVCAKCGNSMRTIPAHKIGSVSLYKTEQKTDLWYIVVCVVAGLSLLAIVCAILILR